MEKLVKPHNLLFKDVYKEKRYSMDLFKLTLSKEEMDLFNWKTLKVKKKSFYGPEWENKRADLIFSVKIKKSHQNTEILFLLEHKSYKSQDIFLQLLEYQVFMYRKNNTPVIPMVVYHGKSKKWHLPIHFKETLAFDSLEIKKAFGKNVLNFSYRLLNIGKLDFKNLSLTSKPILFIMQRIWDLKNPILKGDILKELFLMGREIKDSTHYKELMKIAVSYIMNYDSTTSWQDLQDVEKEIVPKKGEPIMSLMKSVYQGWKEEGIEEGIEKGMEKGMERGREEGIVIGIEKGIEKGREEGREKGREEYKSQMAVKMLKKGMKIATICDLTGLSIKDIKKIEKKL